MVATRHTLLQMLSISQASSYVCRSCRHQLSRSRLVIQQQRSVSSSKSALPTIEQVQPKTVDPSSLSSSASQYGAEDLAGRHAPDVVEQDLEEVDAQSEELQDTRSAQPDRPVKGLNFSTVTVDVEDAPGYTPAETWQGLQYVGSGGNWRDMPASEDDEFSSWIGPTANAVRGREQLVSCLHQALLESGISASGDGAQSASLILQTRLDRKDPLTFTALKRFSQLSGHRIPDPTLNSLLSSNRPLSYLIDQLVERVVQPKPKKIAEILMQRSGLSNQGNVMIFPRRETSIDKEKEVGRWKVIERELRDRGLPVSGGLKHL